MLLPPVPTNHEARVSTIEAVRPVADLFDGRLHVAKRCPRVKRHRVCNATITGPVRIRLRVTVRETPDSYVVSARFRK